MAEERENSGSLNKNDRKEQPNHADYRGKAMIGGVPYWINAWIKEGQSGKFMSLSFKPRNEEAPAKPAKKAGPAVDEDLPFAPRGMWD